MFIALPSFAATLNRASKPQDPIRILCLLVPLLGLALGISGCQAPVAAPAPSLTAARSLSSLSSAAAQVQSSPLCQQARQDCKKRYCLAWSDRLGRSPKDAFQSGQDILALFA